MLIRCGRIAAKPLWNINVDKTEIANKPTVKEKIPAGAHKAAGDRT